MNVDPPDKNVKRIVIYHADSEFNSSRRTLDSTRAPNSTSSGATKRDYIEAESGRKDIFFIFLFVIVFLSFLGICGYGCYLAYEPIIKSSASSYGAFETDVISLSTILAQIFTTATLAGVVSLITNATLCLFPKAIYQATILCSPLIYLALSIGAGYYWGAQAAGVLFLGLFLLHALYLIVRKKHIRMYRYLMLESVKIGLSDDKYFTPLLLWAGMLLFTGFAITGAFGQFKMYLDKYDSDGALYAFYFSVIV